MEILRQRPNSVARLKIPWPTENCGPYSLQHAKLRPTCLELTSWKSAEINYYSHVRMLSIRHFYSNTVHGFALVCNCACLRCYY